MHCVLKRRPKNMRARGKIDLKHFALYEISSALTFLALWHQFTKAKCYSISLSVYTWMCVYVCVHTWVCICMYISGAVHLRFLTKRRKALCIYQNLYMNSTDFYLPTWRTSDRATWFWHKNNETNPFKSLSDLNLLFNELNDMSKVSKMPKLVKNWYES